MRFSLLSLLALTPLLFASPIPMDPYPVPTHTPTGSEIIQTTESTQLNKRGQATLNQFLAVLINNLPAIEGTINVVGGVLTTFEGLLAVLTKQSTTYNEANGDCKTYTVLFARGTTEPGNVGILAGPPFFEALDAIVGKDNVAIQGVNNYQASIEDYLRGGDAKGSAEMAREIANVRTKCPNTKLIAAGYSQGGQLVHNAAKMLPADTMNWVSKVVIFGDPLSHFQVPNIDSSKTKVFCSPTDNICDNGDLILPAHLLYAKDALAAAQFAAT